MKNNFIILMCVAAFLYAVSFSLIFKAEPVLDSKQFDGLGMRLAEGHGFVDELMKPTMIREPAYPYFLALIYAIFGHSYAAVYITQALLFAGIALLTFAFAKGIFGNEVAMASAAAVAIFPTLADYSIYILSEIFFTFFLMGLVLVLSKSLRHGSNAGISAGGVLASLLALTKGIMIFLPFFMVAAFFIYGLGKRDFLKVFITRSVVFLLAFVICVSPWIMRNNNLFGTPLMTIRGGKALYNRALKLEYDWPRWRKILAYSISEFYGSKAYPDAAVKPNEFLLIEDRIAEKKMAKLVKDGLSYAEADKAMATEAIGCIKKRPFRYLAQSMLESIKLFGFFHLPSLNEKNVIDLFSGIKDGNVLLSLIRGVMRLSSYVIFILSILGLWISRRYWREWLVALTVILYIWVVYSLTFSWGRYTVPLIPLFMVFAAAFFKRKMTR